MAKKKATKVGDQVAPMFDAVTRGDVEVVRILLAADPELKGVKNDDGMTPLHVAATAGHVNIVESLLDAKARVDTRDKDGWTAMVRAALHGHADVARFLVDRGADPLVMKTKNRWTPLHEAIMNSYSRGWPITKAVPILLNLGANPNVQTDQYKSKSTPLHYILFHYGSPSASKQRAIVVESLLEHGADPNLREAKYGRTPLHCAAIAGQVHEIDLMLRHSADIEAADENGMTPLMHAVSHGHLAATRCLVEHGARHNDPVPEKTRVIGGMTPLAIAQTFRYTYIARYLKLKRAKGGDPKYHEAANAKNGAELNNACQRGHLDDVAMMLEDDPLLAGMPHGLGVGQGYPIHQAVACNQPEVLRLLLKHSVDPNIGAPPFGETALHDAAKSGHVEMARMLIGAGADVNRAYKFGTPLHAAVDYGQPDSVKLLLDAGADVTVKDHRDRTPLFISKHKPAHHAKMMTGVPSRADDAERQRLITEMLAAHGAQA
ncbi:MAG: hypothetical protein GC159_20680 [Phycisphaera sp.]|nr:hypothetical protein [Phycisphaera sp.]